MGETNGDNKKKTAREIIENYNGPKVRIMEVCGTHSSGNPQIAAGTGGVDLRSGMSGLRDTGQLYR